MTLWRAPFVGGLVYNKSLVRPHLYYSILALVHSSKITLTCYKVCNVRKTAMMIPDLRHME